jgi:HAE1 family hydrophobic/amphiphilic exporter-1
MNLSRFSVRHPVSTVMACLIVILLGAVSLYRLAIDLMPDITYPTISITTEYENASPEEIEELVTRLVEEAMSAVPGVEEVNSVSSEGRSTVRVTFSWGTDLDAAANDIRDRLDRIISRLPEGVERPRLRKFDLAQFPIVILGASSNLDPIQMRQIIDDQIKYRIERIPGVASLDVWGGLNREIHVSLNPERIKALELPLDRILARIREENVTLPAGSIERGPLDVTIRTPGVFTGLDELRRTVIAIRDGVPIQLGEIAAVTDAWEKRTRIIRVNGQPGVRMAVNKQSGTNTVEVADAVLREVERINQDFPQIRVTPVIDTSDYIKRSITNVGTTILYGGVLAIFVLFLFLGSIPSTAIIATAIPISIIATFSLMYFGGFTLNIMTLGGLALGIGMLVDNAIVVLENIHRMGESGLDPEESAVQGSQEVVAAVTASTLTTLVVFLPLIFVRGMSGVMFKQLSYVVAFALTCSLLVALTLVPMLASRMRPSANRLTAAGKPSGHRLFRAANRLFNGLEREYAGLLQLAVTHKKTVIALTVLIFGGSLTLIPLVGVEFMPATDEAEVRVNAEMAVGTRLEVLGDAFRKIEAVITREVPEAKSMSSFIGGSGWRARANTGTVQVALKPKSERDRSSEEVAAALRRELRNIPGMTVRTRAGQGLMVLRLGTGDGEKVQIDIRGYDLAVADELARRVLAVVEGVGGVTDAQVSRESGTPEEQIIVDRRKAADMLLTVTKIAEMLKTVLSGSTAGFFREGGKEYRILVKLQDAEKRDLREILNLPVSNAAGEPVVLRNVVDVRPRSGPILIERRDQERIISVSANISGRDMGSILADIREGLQNIPVPRDFSIVFGGDYEEQQKSFRELLLGFVLSILLIYMVMASLFESLRDPLIVIFAVPVAAIGVIVMLLLTGTTFNVQSYIGCIMLGGIAVNNAILLVDHTNLLRRRDGMELVAAIAEAGRRRLRPILMTSVTTILAMSPLALGMGEGGEAQAPMARAIIGGLISSNLITLIFIPTLYAVFNRRKGATDGR